MIIRDLQLSKAAIIEAEPFKDHRGLFARFYCSQELKSIMGGREIANVNFSRTDKAGTVRGMHFQLPPNAEMKLVRCIRGAIFDVIVDIRKGSATFLKWHGELLTDGNMRMVCVPEGFAHGFQAMEDNSEALYLTTASYRSDSEDGLRFDDPALNIAWPAPVTEVSIKDLSSVMIADRHWLNNKDGGISV
jgi:dTDP-4-dehydrorhamnose 3,5-epimerase